MDAEKRMAEFCYGGRKDRGPSWEQVKELATSALLKTSRISVNILPWIQSYTCDKLSLMAQSSRVAVDTH